MGNSTSSSGKGLLRGLRGQRKKDSVKTTTNKGETKNEASTVTVDPSLSDKQETTAQVCSRLIMPATKEKRWSMIEQWGLTQHKANRFISHSWSYSFSQVVETIVSFELARGITDLNEVYVWMDTLVVDQHDAPVRKQDWWSSTFHNAIKEIGSVILVVQPWYDPKALTRAWCLWEIYGSARFDADFHIALPPDQKNHFLQTLITDFKSIQKMLSLVNSVKAEATNESDLTMIRHAIETSIGYEGVNRMILTQLRSWLVESSLEALQMIQQRNLPSAPELATSSGEALMENQIARLYNLQSDVRLAMEHQKRAYDLDLKELASQQEEAEADATKLKATKEKLGRDLNNLGYLSLKQGNLDSAADFLSKSKEMRSEVFGPDSPEVGRTEFNLGEVNETKGAFEDCLSLYQRSANSLLAANHNQDAIKVFQGMGRVHKLRGDFVKSEECFKRALDLGGRDSVHPDVAEVWGMYATLLTDTDRFEEARKALETAREIQVRNLGSFHPNVAEIENNMARLLARLGKYEEALDRQRQALAIDQKAFGDTHLQCARDANNLCHLLTALGRLDEARENIDKAMEIRSAKLGTQHPLYARTSCNSGKVDMVSGHLKEAEEKYRRAREVIVRINPNHQDVGEIDHMIAECEYLAGDYDGCEASLALAIGNPNCSDSNRVEWKLLLVKCLTDHAKLDEAKTVLNEAEALSRSVCASLEKNIFKVDLLSGRARLLEAIGDIPGAIELQRKALEALQASGEGETLDASRDLNNLGFLLTHSPTSLSGVQEGVESLKKALAIRQRALGDDNPATIRVKYNIALALFELGDDSNKAAGMEMLRRCCDELAQQQNKVHVLVAHVGMYKLLLFINADKYRNEARDHIQSRLEWIQSTLGETQPLRWEALILKAYAEKDKEALVKACEGYFKSVAKQRTNITFPLLCLWQAELNTSPEEREQMMSKVKEYCDELNLHSGHRFRARYDEMISSKGPL